MTDSPLVTRVFKSLPDALQRKLTEVLKQLDITLLLKFYFGEKNILREKGWFESERRGFPVDGEGNPIPWYTYSAIDFLESVDIGGLSVFEYGGGYSTIWYAKRAEQVTAVEHAAEWVEEIENEIPDNGEILHRTDETAYTEEITNHADVDIAIIDGKYRLKCLEPSIASLSDNGVIVWDDYHRYEEDKDELFNQMFEEDFSVLPFYGLKGLNAHYRCTAIFYRENNCLGI